MPIIFYLFRMSKTKAIFIDLFKLCELYIFIHVALALLLRFILLLHVMCVPETLNSS